MLPVYCATWVCWKGDGSWLQRGGQRQLHTWGTPRPCPLHLSFFSLVWITIPLLYSETLIPNIMVSELWVTVVNSKLRVVGTPKVVASLSEVQVALNLCLVRAIWWRTMSSACKLWSNPRKSVSEVTATGNLVRILLFRHVLTLFQIISGCPF